MKQRKVVSLIGALVVILGAVAFITGCPHANSNKDKKNNMTVNNGGTTSNNGGTTGGNTGNNGDSLAVQPMGKADPTLKGTSWSGGGKSIYFNEDGNIASINGSEEMLYTIQGEKISFDLSSFITIAENMTEEKFIRKMKIEIKQDIAKFEKEIREAEKDGDEERKRQLEAKLTEAKELLQMFENPDERTKRRIKESLEGIHEYAGKMKANAKFDGIFNSEKIRLTIEHFPEYDWSEKKVTIKKIIFEKE